MSREFTRMSKPYWVYVIQSLAPRYSKRGVQLPGVYYVGMTTDPPRRLRQHNGEIVGGGRYTSKHRPFEPRALYGPYDSRSDALKAERALKHGHRGVARTRWSPEHSPWCRGLGPSDPWVMVVAGAEDVEEDEEASTRGGRLHGRAVFI